MPIVATETIILGSAQVEPGDEVPSSFVDPFGDEQPVDVDRLVELGFAEKARGKASAKAAPAETED